MNSSVLQTHNGVTAGAVTIHSKPSELEGHHRTCRRRVRSGRRTPYTYTRSNELQLFVNEQSVFPLRVDSFSYDKRAVKLFVDPGGYPLATNVSGKGYQRLFIRDGNTAAFNPSEKPALQVVCGPATEVAPVYGL